MELQYVVTESHSAAHLGSGDLPVLATPALVAILENVAMKEALPLLEIGATTVGSQITIDHLRPTAIGDTVTATATLIRQENRKLTFALTATDSKGEIARGQHERFIVDRKRFMSKL